MDNSDSEQESSPKKKSRIEYHEMLTYQQQRQRKTPNEKVMEEHYVDYDIDYQLTDGIWEQNQEQPNVKGGWDEFETPKRDLSAKKKSTDKKKARDDVYNDMVNCVRNGLLNIKAVGSVILSCPQEYVKTVTEEFITKNGASITDSYSSKDAYEEENFGKTLCGQNLYTRIVHRQMASLRTDGSDWKGLPLKLDVKPSVNKIKRIVRLPPNVNKDFKKNHPLDIAALDLEISTKKTHVVVGLAMISLLQDITVKPDLIQKYTYRKREMADSDLKPLPVEVVDALFETVSMYVGLDDEIVQKPIDYIDSPEEQHHSTLYMSLHPTSDELRKKKLKALRNSYAKFKKTVFPSKLKYALEELRGSTIVESGDGKVTFKRRTRGRKPKSPSPE